MTRNRRNRIIIQATGDLTAYHGPTTKTPVDHVAVAGDWHGHTGWARKVIRTVAAHNINVILHVGDFGIWPGEGTNYRAELEKTCKDNGVVILVTPGNHEWWDAIDQVEPTDRGDGWGPVKWFTNHIGVLPRGHRFTLTTTTGTHRTVLSLGGAPSIDSYRRREGIDWWPTEQITEADVAKVITDGTADIMLTHDAPDEPYTTDAVFNILLHNPMGWPQHARDYAAIGRDRITRAFEGVAPATLVHGHYHVDDETVTDYVPGLGPGREGGCRVVSLNEQTRRRNTRTLDLNTLTYQDIAHI